MLIIARIHRQQSCGIQPPIINLETRKQTSKSIVITIPSSGKAQSSVVRRQREANSIGGWFGGRRANIWHPSHRHSTPFLPFNPLIEQSSQLTSAGESYLSKNNQQIAQPSSLFGWKFLSYQMTCSLCVKPLTTGLFLTTPQWVDSAPGSPKDTFRGCQRLPLCI